MPIGIAKCGMLGSTQNNSGYSIALNTSVVDGITTAHAWGTQTKNAASFWFKQTSTGENRHIANCGWVVGFNSSDKLEMVLSAPNGQLVSTATYTDTASWHHILAHWDTGNATAGDRMRVWYDGAEVTSFTTDTNPTLNRSASSTLLALANIGGETTGAKVHQLAFFDNALPSIGSVYPYKTNATIAALSGCVAVVASSATVLGDAKGSYTWTNGTNTPTLSTDVP